jgi:hypothetical protein
MHFNNNNNKRIINFKFFLLLMSLFGLREKGRMLLFFFFFYYDICLRFQINYYPLINKKKIKSSKKDNQIILFNMFIRIHDKMS